jgi:hypothetical protein
VNQIDPKMLTENLAKIGDAIQRVGQAFLLAAVSLSESWDEWTEAAYRSAVGRPPGSDRTARLQKKRRAAIDRWAHNLFDD